MATADATLIFTDSHDVTTDLVLQYLPSADDRIFRFNFDQFAEYDFWMTPEAFQITDPTGRSITHQSTKKAYYRKARRSRISLATEADYIENEMWTVYQHLVCRLWEQNKLVLVEPFTERLRVSKYRQLQLAASVFRVPQTVFSTRIGSHMPHWDQTVVKSFAGGRIGGRTLYTTLVNPHDLDISYPWLLQEYIEALADVTVVYVRGTQFAFRLERNFLEETVDCRASSEVDTWKAWLPYELSETDQMRIHKFMDLMTLDFGRLDFLLTDSGELTFCEVNQNGQFAWLDLEDKCGLLSRIASEISPSTDVHPLPFSLFAG